MMLQETTLPGEALNVVMGNDGRLHVGHAGLIRVDAAVPGFFDAVVADLVEIARSADGRRRVDGASLADHTVRIEQPASPTIPANGWVLPDDLPAATPAGRPTGLFDPSGKPVEGTGAGCGSTIFYEPAVWARKSAGPYILDPLLRQAEMNATGTADNTANNGTAQASAPPPADLRLTCSPGKSGDRLTFAYSLQNNGPGEVFIMDALPSLEPTSGEPQAVEQPAVIILRPDGDAMLGRFLAPLPIDRRVAVSAIPLARRLPPRATLERQLEVPLPLAETSPYFPDLTLRRYKLVEIRAVLFTIGYWAAGDAGVLAAPVDYAPGLCVIGTRNAAGAARRVSQRFATSALQLFQRDDAFPRHAD
jgi:hypothetical protein